MMVELVAAGIIGAALLWLVLQPIVAPSQLLPVDTDPLDPEETPQGQALLALKEIEFDRATGKLSEDDYAMLNARYSTAAIATMETSVASFCTMCGAKLPHDATFCPACGTKTASVIPA